MLSAEMDAMLEEALRLCQAGELTQAEQIYRRVLAHFADTPDAWNMLAQILYRQDRLEEAAEATEHATRLRPNIAPYWLTRGNIALARNRGGEAQSGFSRALELDPAFAEAHYRLALSYHREDRTADAIAAYRTALRYAPDVAEIHYQLAAALTAEARWGEALATYQQAFKRDTGGAFDRRGALDCLWYLKWDALPAFWHDELTRFFARADVDKNRYVSIGLRALRSRSAFRTVIDDAARQPEGRLETDAAALRDVMRNELFQRLLRDALIADAGFERFLVRLRAALLADAGLRAQAPLEFLCALALQCFNNEFIFAESQIEGARVVDLTREVDAGLQPDLAAPEPMLRAVAVLAMYRPLDTMRNIEGWAARGQVPAALAPLLQRTVLDVVTERALRQDIGATGAITGGESGAACDRNEEHPYPRWFSFDRGAPVTLSDWLLGVVTGLKTPAEFPGEVRILVAGCGTGKAAIDLATLIVGARVLAVDPSLPSLAYAQRMAGELGVTNVEFRQGDILELGVLTERFDLISCSGMRDHLRDPQAAMRVLVRLLRAGGLLWLALPSERARAGVTAAREIIRQQQLAPSASAIREFRQYVFSLNQDTPLKSLPGMLDFYAMSPCRDLLFREQEPQFRLPQIAAMLRDHGLNVLSLLQGMPRPALLDYRRMFPRDETLTDLQNWDAFEAQYPRTFAGMYQILCQKPGAAPQ